MRRLITLILCMLGIIVAACWLVGYARAVWPFAASAAQDRDLSFLTYPNIKWYTEVDEKTGRMSDTKIEWFSVSDGPTGVVYAQQYFPCWIVSLCAVATLGSCAIGFMAFWPRRSDGWSKGNS